MDVPFWQAVVIVVVFYALLVIGAVLYTAVAGRKWRGPGE
jgi:hypothetical protein